MQDNEQNEPVKMDTFRPGSLQEILVNSGEYILVPINVKMDALKVKIIAVPPG
jgi:hypothetical protein